VANKPDKFYVMATSLEDRYDDRPEILDDISLSQFAKRCTLDSKRSETNEDEQLFEKGTAIKVKEEEENPHDLKADVLKDEIKQDFIIVYNSHTKQRLPKTFKVGNRQMRLRRPLALRFHKFSKTKERHQYYFSQPRLYHPHRPEDLERWEQDEDECIYAYREAEDAINYVKSKVMKYEDKVEEAQTKAQEEFDNQIGDILDSTKEQEDEDCLDEGMGEPSYHMAIDPDAYYSDNKKCDEVHDGFYKKNRIRQS
jgi:hypothetical protein